VPTLLVVIDGRAQRRFAEPRGTRAIAELLGPWLR
jgi:hypothetical protein